MSRQYSNLPNLRFGILKVAHFGDVLTDFSAKYNASRLFLPQLSLIDGYSHIVMQIMPAKEESLREFLEISESYSDVKYIEVLKARGLPPTILMVKRNYGVLRALQHVGGVKVGSVVVYRGHKYFPVALRRGTEASLLRYVVRYSPCDLEVKFLGKYSRYWNLNQLPVLSEYEVQVIRTALREGYFDWPRKASLADIASRLGISKVTAAEHLRRALKKLVEIYDKGLNFWGAGGT